MKCYQQTVCITAILQDLYGITKQSCLLLLLFYSNLSWSQSAEQIATCQQHLQANRLMVGQSGNAYSCFKKLLSEYPESDAVYLGLQEIETRYVLLIDRALSDGKTETVESYLNRLQQVVDDDERFARLMQRWETSDENAAANEQTVDVSQDETLNIGTGTESEPEESMIQSMRQQLDECRQLLQSSQHQSAFHCYEQRLQQLIAEHPDYYPGAPYDVEPSELLLR